MRPTFMVSYLNRGFIIKSLRMRLEVHKYLNYITTPATLNPLTSNDAHLKYNQCPLITLTGMMTFNSVLSDSGAWKRG